MKITGSAPVFSVRNLAASAKYFVDILDFHEDYRGEAYAIFERDSAIIHLSLESNPHNVAPGSGSVYFYCDEVDDYYQELVKRGALLDTPPQNYPYGMRDFVVFDPDKNRLTFGCPAKKG